MNEIDPQSFFKEFEATINLAKLKMAELNGSRGNILVDEFRLIGKTYRIHLANYHELNKAFEKYFDLSFAINFWRQDGESDREKFMDEISRLLHNFLSSSSTLIDHTRVVNKRILDGQPFLSEYNEKVKSEFTENGLIQFVKKFRNYFSHIGITPISFGHQLVDGRFSVDIVIIKDELNIEDEIWNTPSRKFISIMPNEADLRPIIDIYCHRIERFYLWYQDRFAQIFESEFQASRKMQNEYNELVKLSEMQHRKAMLAMHIELSKSKYGS